MSIDWHVKILAEVDSTQDLAMMAAAQGNPEGFVIQAMRQTNARGRHGNQWDAPMGNIYMSLLLRPDCGLERAGEIAFVIAVALSNTIDLYINKAEHKKALKWPNDVLVDGRKISGILLETNITDGELNGLVVGIGLNIFNSPELAISLNDVAKEPVYVNKVRDSFFEQLEKVYATWQQKGFKPIREKWLRQAHGIDEPMTARLPNISYKGSFGGLTDDGSLVLKEDNGNERIIHAAEVHFGHSEAEA